MADFNGQVRHTKLIAPPDSKTLRESDSKTLRESAKGDNRERVGHRFPWGFRPALYPCSGAQREEQGAPYFCVLLPLFAPPLPGAALLGQETMSWSAFDGWAGAPPSCLHIAS